MYDIVIIGAGIAGLRVGIETLTRYPGKKCCILEKYDYNGGRVVTYHTPKNKLHWEGGAGRISMKHKKVLQLLKNIKCRLFH